jgi:hypothetical protein
MIGNKTLIAALALAATAVTAIDASAQTETFGRQGAHGGGHGYSATVTTTPTANGTQTTGSVQTNAGYGAAGTHTVNITTGAATTTVTTNNGTTATTSTMEHNGVYYGAATVTAPNGKSVAGAGAIYAH